MDTDVTVLSNADVPTASGHLGLDVSGDDDVIADNPAHDLEDAAITMSFTLDALAVQTGLFAKDANGNTLGVFSVQVDPDGQVVALWQGGSSSYQIYPSVGKVGVGAEHSVHVSLDNASCTIEP